MSQPDANYTDEWKCCRDAIDRFDGILVDLRKYGCSILTGLTTAGSFLGTSASGVIQVGVIIVTMALTVVLYYLDMYYQSLLFGSLFRARFLEIFKLNRGLTFHISAFYGASHAGRFLHFLYYGFLSALLILGTVVAVANTQYKTATPSPQASNLLVQNGNNPHLKTAIQLSNKTKTEISANCVAVTSLSTCIYSLFSSTLFLTVIIAGGTSFSFMVILVARSDQKRKSAVQTISRLLEMYRKDKDDLDKVNELEEYFTKYFQQYV